MKSMPGLLKLVQYLADYVEVFGSEVESDLTQNERQASRYRSPENSGDAECTYSSEIDTIKMNRPCYQNV